MTVQKIKSVLEELGYKLSDSGSHWRTSALYRGGSNPTALKIYKDSGVWVDYVEESKFLPLKSLVSATLQTNDSEVIKRVLGANSDIQALPQSPPPSPRLDIEKTYPDSILDKLLPHYKFYNDKGISSSTLKFFKGGLATEGSLYQRFVFPIYNQDLKIHGFSGRDMSGRSNSKRPKWKHVGKKSKWIYPFYVPFGGKIHPIQDAILSKGEIILVESIGDLLNCHEHGYKNVLPIFGTSLSSALICFLVSLGLKKIIISLNNDKDSSINRGEVGALKIYLKLLGFFDKGSLLVHLPPKNDFGDMNAEDFSLWKSEMDARADSPDDEKLHSRIKDLIKSGHISRSLYKKKYF